MILYWDFVNLKLVRGLANSTPVTSYSWTLRDILPFSIYLLRASTSITSPYTVTDLEAGQSFIFGAKRPNDLSGNYLIYQPIWTKVGSGSTLHYEADIDLNTTELIDAVGSGTSLALTAEFTVIHTDNTERYSTQFTLNILADVNRGTEVVPHDITPIALQYFTEDGVAKVRMVNALGQTCGVFTPS